jgi:hypothetical protein
MDSDSSTKFFCKPPAPLDFIFKMALMSGDRLQLTRRIAKESDLDSLTEVLLEAAPLDPIYPYRFPGFIRHSCDFRVRCREKCKEYLTTSTVIVVVVKKYNDPSWAPRLIAFGVWQGPESLDMTGPTVQRPITGKLLPSRGLFANLTYILSIAWGRSDEIIQGRDGNSDRIRAFRRSAHDAKANLFDSEFGQNQMFLKVLVCKPEYHRKGAGTAITLWGVEMAYRHNLPVTLFASPMGLYLYRSLGFTECGGFSVPPAPGDVGMGLIPALVLKGRNV